MFRKPPSTLQPPLEKLDTNAPEWADGFIHLIRQTALVFGSDRKEPVEWRPCLTLTRQEPAVTVLPATRKGKVGHPDYFALPSDQTLFRDKPAKPGFLFYRYETLHPSKLGQKIGVIPHPIRLAVMAWVVDRYSEK